MALEGLRARFFGTQTPEEATAQEQRERAWEQQYGGSTAGVERPILDPTDALAGGLSALPKGLAAVLADVGADLFVSLSAEAAANNDYLKSMYIGPKGMKALGIDASKDLAGQFSSLVDKIPRKEIDTPQQGITLRPKEAEAELETTLRELVEEHSPYAEKAKQLFQAYPQLRNLKVRPIMGGESAFDPTTKGGPSIFLGVNEYYSPQTQSLAHELQHAIQQIEGLPRGGQDTKWFWDSFEKRMKDLNEDVKLEIKDARDALEFNPDDRELLEELQYLEDLEQVTTRNLRNIDRSDDYENYWRLAGEAEARDAGMRRFFTREQKARIQPGILYDVKKEKKPIPMQDLIIKKDF